MLVYWDVHESQTKGLAGLGLHMYIFLPTPNRSLHSLLTKQQYSHGCKLLFVLGLLHQVLSVYGHPKFIK